MCVGRYMHDIPLCFYFHRHSSRQNILFVVLAKNRVYPYRPEGSKTM
jgi:hypothetical protein